MGIEWELETSPSNRAGCRKCGEKIERGELRLKHFVGYNYGHAEHQFYHARCGTKYVEDDIIDLDKMLNTIDKYLKRRV